MLLQRFLNLFRRRAPELNPLDAYALWADAYPPKAHNDLMRIEERSMLGLLPDVKSKIVLDLACGSGRYILKAKERGAAIVYGLDFSLPMLLRASAVSDRLALGNMNSLPFKSDSMDIIICGLSIGHVSDMMLAFREISRILRPNGVVVYSDIHPFGRFAGWRRNFQDVHGREFSVENYFHLYGEHHRACRLNGLDIEDVREPLIAGSHRWSGSPAIIAIRARKK